MEAEFLRRAARAGCVALLLACGISSAAALDAFWHGRRGPIWEDGINAAANRSNWYSQSPLQGEPREVPNGIAIFAEGARENDIRILDVTQISQLLFLKTKEAYSFEVRGFFTVNGAGIRNRNRAAPEFTIFDQGGMVFRGDARVETSGEGWGARFRVKNGGRLVFQGTSSGGLSATHNAGVVEFDGSSSAGRMTIENSPQGDGPAIASVRFYDRSTGGNADIYNGQDSLLSFATTKGPEGGEVSAGKIENRGSFDIGTTTLKVKKNLRLLSQGTLSIARVDEHHGSIQVRNNMLLSGTLLTTGFFTEPGRYTLLRASGHRRGKFDNLVNGGRLEYGPHTVVLVIGD